MKDKCLVSVVIPTYNAEKFIRECLKATLDQTYDNLEIIIVDDGSTDSTVDICKTYAERDGRIKLFNLENRGVSSARNYGMKKADGDYIVFFDADDYPEKELVARYMAAYEEWHGKDVAFVCCGMFYDNLYNKNVDNREIVLESGHGYIKGETYLLNRKTASTLSWLKLFNFVTNKCYDLRNVKELDIRFDEKVNIGEDLKFNLDLLDKCPGNLGMINQPLYHYVKRSDSSLSISYHPEDLDDTKEIYRRYIEWESRQAGVTPDNVLVVKSVFITDWVSRLTAMYEEHKHESYMSPMRVKLRKEIQSKEFKTILSEVYRARKISALRYYSLKTGRFGVFFFFRGIYQILKG